MRNDGTRLIQTPAMPAIPAPAVTRWSAELTEILAPYLVSADEQMAQGRPGEAVAMWEAALNDVSGCRCRDGERLPG